VVTEARANGKWELGTLAPVDGSVGRGALQDLWSKPRAFGGVSGTWECQPGLTGVGRWDFSLGGWVRGNLGTCVG
jgi:hypothetical protein